MSPLLPHDDASVTWLARLGPASARAAGRAGFWARCAMAFVIAVALLRLSLQWPTPDSVWLPFAMLAAMPWSLALLLLDPTAGLADRGAWVVAVGLAINGALVVWLVCSLRQRVRRARGARRARAARR